MVAASAVRRASASCVEPEAFSGHAHAENAPGRGAPSGDTESDKLARAHAPDKRAAANSLGALPRATTSDAGGRGGSEDSE